MSAPRTTCSFLVLGAGAWGTALAMYLAKQQHRVVLWGHHPEKMALLQEARCNAAVLPGVAFPESLRVVTELREAFVAAGNDPIICLAIPSHAFAFLCAQIASLVTQPPRLFWGTKGLAGEGRWLHEVCIERCAPRAFAVLSGPSFALEVAKGLPCALTLAAHPLSFGRYLQQALHSSHFRVYLSEDYIGVQLGGVFKNVLAIAVGMAEGLGLGANARAALMTRGLAELCRLGKHLHVKRATLMGLAGVGDMIVTCTDNQSRNRRFGLALGQGSSQEEAKERIGQVVEGSFNAEHLISLARKYQVEMPICQQVYNVLYEGTTTHEAMQHLLRRTPKNETF